MLSLVYSIVFWLFVVISSCVLFIFAVIIRLITAPFDHKQRLLHYFTCFWASIYTWINPSWSVQIHGRDKIKNSDVFVIICNHQSIVDIFVLFRLFFPFKWVSKVENFWIPIIGWNMTLNKYIRLVRGKKKSQVKMLEHCGQTLKQGTSVLIFPEGTRSSGDTIRPMKRGAFQIAQDYQTDILPIVLSGSSAALPKSGFMLRGRHTIHITILDKIPYDTFSELSVQELTSKAQTLMQDKLDRLAKNQNQIDS